MTPEHLALNVLNWQKKSSEAIACDLAAASREMKTGNFAERISFVPLEVVDSKFFDPDLGFLENYLSDDGPGYLGKVIADTDGTDCIEVGELDIDKAVKEATKIIEKYGFKKEDIKIYYGTRAC